ncbi:SCO family protein, partial [Luminiphilus sp.]|nr:SCO family protein [Luminiphilus sp.]
MTLTQQQRVGLTVFAVLLGITIIVAGFVHRIQQPRIMTMSEMRANGLFIFDTPRDPGKFALTSHKGTVFSEESLEGDWTLLFFGFTFCPDVCPTTLSFLAGLKENLEGTEAESTDVVMVSVDPARDTVDQLSQYVPYFHPEFLGVTGEFPEILSFARRFNAPFRKVPTEDGDYQVDHSANVVLINP